MRMHRLTNALEVVKHYCTSIVVRRMVFKMKECFMTHELLYNSVVFSSHADGPFIAEGALRVGHVPSKAKADVSF